jgi:hypothetical protein
MQFSHPVFPHPVLSLPLKIRTRRKERDALIHDRLADPQVVVDPLLDARRLGELVRLHTGAVSGRVVLAVFRHDESLVQ